MILLSPRNLRVISLVGGILSLVCSLLPWYSISARIMVWQDSLVLSVDAFLWGIRVNGSIPSSIASGSGLPQLATESYLELMEHVPSEYRIYLYFPLAILALAMVGSILVLLGTLKQGSGYSRAVMLTGSLLSLGSVVLFAAGIYVAYSQIAGDVPIPVESPFFGRYSTSILVVSVTLSWGLSYGWVGTLIGSILSWAAFLLSARRASTQPELQATFPKSGPRHVYCIHCGAAISPDALSCQRCGRKQEYAGFSAHA